MTRPNVIFILADDMGYGDMSLFNGGLTLTPVLDTLASEPVHGAVPASNQQRYADAIFEEVEADRHRCADAIFK